MTRRAVLERLMLAAGASAVWPAPTFAQGPAFPKGAIIRTLFKDMAPEELAGGATPYDAARATRRLRHPAHLQAAQHDDECAHGRIMTHGAPR